ncbi:hypothetical protein LCGC14_0548080 [marine sediment metagenome]|uniref:Uncharacterized protein n=1 Tax=marine sediment metagenome TaxID=412755 RepID=A0A0F9S988_9ZZZZ
MKLKRIEEEIEPEDELEPLDDGLGIDDPLNDGLGDDLFADDFYGMGGQSPLDKHKDLLKDLTNFSPYLKDTVNNWLGLTWDEKAGKYISSRFIKPIMSIQGAAWCIGLMKTYARNNNIITDIGEAEYKNILSDHISAIWLNLGTRPELGIKDDGDLIRVANEMEHSAALVMMGAGDGKYNKMLGTTYSHHTTGAINPNQGMGMIPGQMMPGQMVKEQKPSMLQKVKKLLTGA